jgi:hypothetical protein
MQLVFQTDNLNAVQVFSNEMNSNVLVSSSRYLLWSTEIIVILGARC